MLQLIQPTGKEYNKMEDGLLSLKWNNHKTTFFEILKVLRDKANYTDATLAVEGKFYPVHKLVLSTCSEYFSEIFERTPCKSPVIVLKDVRSQDLESLLDYMYLGEVNVNQNDLALLLKTAECLRIKGLAVPDDDPIRHSISTSPRKVNSHTPDDGTRETPPAKRRKEDSSSIPSICSPQRTPPNSKAISSPPHSSKQNKHTEPCSPEEENLDTPMVKVEMEEVEGEETFQSDTNYDSNNEAEREFTVEKSELDESSYPNANFPVTSSQPTPELSWEDGENSFPQDSYGGDPSSQQAGGESDEAGPSCASASCLPLLQVSPTVLRPHGGYRRHCPVCGKGFDQPYNLQRHIRTHTGERPFPCPFCSYAASERSHLKSHVARKHRQEYITWVD